MRIGIYLNLAHYHPHEGGGFSYVSTLLGHLLASASNHEFVFLLRDDSGSKAQAFTSEPWAKGRETVRYGFITEEQYLSRSRIYRLLDGLISWRTSLRLFFGGVIERLQAEAASVNKREFERLVAGNGIDLVYYPMVHNYPSTDVPYFATLWDLIHYTAAPFPTAIGKRFAEADGMWREVLLKSTHVVVESESGREALLRHYPIAENKVTVAPLFANAMVDGTAAANPDFEREIKALEGKFFFYPAQYWVHKNHITLLKAMVRLRAQGFGEKLMLTGRDCGTKAIVQQFIHDHGLEDTVRMLDFVPDADLRLLYRHARGLVFPSALGPTNMPLIEALALGCPIVCSDHGGHREICKDAALYFDYADVEGMAGCLRKMAESDDLRNSLVDEGRRVYADSPFKVGNAVNALSLAFDEYDRISLNWRYRTGLN